MLSRRENMKTPLCGEKKEDKHSWRFVQSIHEEFEKKRREICTGSSRGFETESNSIFSDRECEHAATPYEVKRSHMAKFSIRGKEEGGMPKRGTLSGFLHEYESQTQKFRDHTTFLEFCKIMVRRSKQHNMDRFLLYIFYGSPNCSARAWIEELDTFL